MSSGGCFPTCLLEDHWLEGSWFPWRWALPEEAPPKHCSNQKCFIELLEESPRNCQEVFRAFMLNWCFNTCWHLVLPKPGAGCKGMLAHSFVLDLISHFHKRMFPELKGLM